MPTPIERAIDHLNKLEADRSAAIAISKEKAQEAKLIKARQEGFREAMEIFNVSILNNEEEISVTDTDGSKKRRRRNIIQFISNELAFSGKAMTTNQIAKAIDYLPERTEKALERMEGSGQIMRTENGRWVVDPDRAAPNGRDKRPHRAGPGGPGQTAPEESRSAAAHNI